MVIETMHLIKDHIMSFVSIVHTCMNDFSIHTVMFWICIVMGISVLFALIYTLVQYHRSRKKPLKPGHSCLVIELIWAFVPLAIVVLLVIPAMRMML